MLTEGTEGELLEKVKVEEKTYNWAGTPCKKTND